MHAKPQDKAYSKESMPARGDYYKPGGNFAGDEGDIDIPMIEPNFPMAEPNKMPENVNRLRSQAPFKALQAVMKDQDKLGCVLIGDTPIPFVEPNVHPDSEIRDIEACIKNSKPSGLGCCDVMCVCGCSFTILGSCYACKNTVLIDSNQYGFILDSGKVVFLRPGWHYLGYPFMNGLQKFDISLEHIKVANFQIIRIRQDEIGIGIDNTSLEILLPGTHVRVNGAFVFKGRYNLREDFVEGPIKVKTVKTGTVCICYNNGIAEILTEGRYAVNSNGYVMGATLDITQQNLKFKKHKVLLDGGINMLVEGLLTYQVIDVVKLIKNVDPDNLARYLEEIMKADLTKVFATIHLEQISSTTFSEIKKNDARIAETRLFIYESIMKMIEPQAMQWGVHIINFQLESTQLADEKYSLDYEMASLQIAKSKAEQKAQEAQNVILQQKAQTKAKIDQLQAETDSNIQLIKAKADADAIIMQAEAKAQAILKEGEARAQAADMMTSKYGQELALMKQKTKIAEGLKIHTLVTGGEGQGGNGMMNNVVPVLRL